jgi:hypothetical protein
MQFVGPGGRFVASGVGRRAALTRIRPHEAGTTPRPHDEENP